MGLSAVCDCGISLSYSLTIFDEEVVPNIPLIYNQLRAIYILELKLFYNLGARCTALGGSNYPTIQIRQQSGVARAMSKSY